MYTAKQIMKAAFLKARAHVATMTDEDVLYDHTALPYERPSCLFTQRAIDRRARDLFRAMEGDATEPEPVESLADSPGGDWDFLAEALAE